MKLLCLDKNIKTNCKTIIGRKREVKLSPYFFKKNNRQVFVENVKKQTCLSSYFIGLKSLK